MTTTTKLKVALKTVFAHLLIVLVLMVGFQIGSAIYQQTNHFAEKNSISDWYNRPEAELEESYVCDNFPKGGHVYCDGTQLLLGGAIVSVVEYTGFLFKGFTFSNLQLPGFFKWYYYLIPVFNYALFFGLARHFYLKAKK